MYVQNNKILSFFLLKPSAIRTAEFYSLAALCLLQPRGFLDMDGIIIALTCSHSVPAETCATPKQMHTHTRFVFQNDYCQGMMLPSFGTISYLLGGLSGVEVGHKRQCVCVCECTQAPVYVPPLQVAGPRPRLAILLNKLSLSSLHDI